MNILRFVASTKHGKNSNQNREQEGRFRDRPDDDVVNAGSVAECVVVVVDDLNPNVKLSDVVQ